MYGKSFTEIKGKGMLIKKKDAKRVNKVSLLMANLEKKR